MLHWDLHAQAEHILRFIIVGDTPDIIIVGDAPGIVAKTVLVLRKSEKSRIFAR